MLWRECCGENVCGESAVKSVLWRILMSGQHQYEEREMLGEPTSQSLHGYEEKVR